MRNIRIVLWAVVIVLAGVVSWLTIEMTKTREQMVETAYGVPFELTAQTGQPITEKAFQGKPTALFFGFTHCPEVCPTTLFELNGWMEKVDPAGDKLQAYFVSVDPERDTPEIMQQYVSNVSKRITGITGPADKIAETLKGYRIYAKKCRWMRRTRTAITPWITRHPLSFSMPMAVLRERSPMVKIPMLPSRSFRTC